MIYGPYLSIYYIVLLIEINNGDVAYGCIMSLEQGVCRLVKNWIDVEVVIGKDKWNLEIG